MSRYSFIAHIYYFNYTTFDVISQLLLSILLAVLGFNVGRLALFSIKRNNSPSGLVFLCKSERLDVVRIVKRRVKLYCYYYVTLSEKSIGVRHKKTFYALTSFFSCKIPNFLSCFVT